MRITFPLIRAMLVLVALISVSTVNAQQYTKITYVHTEADGTPFAATDSQGNIEWQIDHYPYGGEFSNTQVARKNDIGFAGKPYDDEIGLSYFGARWYDPATGRFTGIDPAMVEVADYRMFNRYSYGFNNPYKFVDPDGRTPELLYISDPQAYNEHIVGPILGVDATTREGIAAANKYNQREAAYELAGIGVAKVLGRSLKLVNTVKNKPKLGSRGGPGEGKAFSEKVKDAARSESGDRCVFCNNETIRSSKPHPRRSNIDHAEPKSRGGNNTLDNAQNTCQSCNLSKGAKNTHEFLNSKKAKK